MRDEQLIPRRTSGSRAATDRVQVVMDLTSRLNVLRHSESEARAALLSEIFGRPVPDTLTLYPPFYCDHGLNLAFGERVFVNQNCAFDEVGGVRIGSGSVIAAGAVIAEDVPPNCLVSSHGYVKRRDLNRQGAGEATATGGSSNAKTSPFSQAASPACGVPLPR